MGFFTWLFGDQDELEQTPAQDERPASDASFDAKLIPELVREHKALFDLYAKTIEHAESQSWHEAGSCLKKFKNLLQTHILKENLKLYSLLRASAKGDKITLETLEDFKTEMDRAGQEVGRFARSYDDIASSPLKRDKFVEDLKAMGPFLIDRVHREENDLYTLYGK